MTEPLVSINIDKNQTLVFYNSHFLYKGKTINYKDVDGISYLLTTTKQSINFIPTAMSVSFEISFQSKGELYKANSSASSVMYFKSEKQKDKEQIFAKLVYIIDNLIKPFVLINLLIEYSRRNEIKLGDSFTVKPDGMYKKRFLRDPDLLPWNQYYNSKLFKGKLYVFEEDYNKKAKTYFTCPMSVMNSVIMPDFLNFLFQNKGVIDEATKKELLKGKERINPKPQENNKELQSDKKFCSSCAAPIDLDSKFCSHCGSEII